jgi:hypothetical protein
MTDYDDDDDRVPHFRAEYPHGRMGIASFAIGVLTVIWEVCVIAGGMTLGMIDQEPEEWMVQLLGFAVLAGVPAAIVGAVLGGVAATLPRQKKLFALLGIGVNVLVFVGLCGLVVLGMAG